MSALDEMGDFLSSSDSARDMENVAKSLGSAIGNVVGASIDSYQKAANGTSAGDPVSSSYFTRNSNEYLNLLITIGKVCMQAK